MISKKQELEIRKEMDHNHTAGVVLFWAGMFILGLVLEPLAIYYFNQEARLGDRYGLNVRTSCGVYRAIAMVLTVLATIGFIITITVALY